jgi:hypothetical protein
MFLKEGGVKIVRGVSADSRRSAAGSELEWLRNAKGADIEPFTYRAAALNAGAATQSVRVAVILIGKVPLVSVGAVTPKAGISINRVRLQFAEDLVRHPAKP